MRRGDVLDYHALRKSDVDVGVPSVIDRPTSDDFARQAPRLARRSLRELGVIDGYEISCMTD